MVIIYVPLVYCGHAVAQLDEAALQAGWSRIRFPMGLSRFFIELILPADSASNRNEYKGCLLGVKAAGV